MKLSKAKKNSRRKFANKGRGMQCLICGSLLIHGVSLDGTKFSSGCPIQYAH